MSGRISKLTLAYYLNWGPYVVSYPAGGVPEGAIADALCLNFGTTLFPLNNGNAQLAGVASQNVINLRLVDYAATGTTRGIYAKVALNGGAGGEAIRAYATVGSAAPVDTCNGAHISLAFTDSGNITGMAEAVRATVEYPAATLGGQVSSLLAEAWAAGGTNTNPTAGSLIRCVLGGNGTGLALLDARLALLSLEGNAAGAGNIFKTGCVVATTAAATSCALKIRVNGTTYYIPVATAIG